MQLITFNPNTENWIKLFAPHPQTGGSDIAFFRGRYQRGGSAFGNLIRNLWRIVPKVLASPIGSAVSSSAAKAASSVINDMKEGNSLKESLKTQGRTMLRDLTGVGRRQPSGRVHKKKTFGFVHVKPSKRTSFIPIV